MPQIRQLFSFSWLDKLVSCTGIQFLDHIVCKWLLSKRRKLPSMHIWHLKSCNEMYGHTALVPVLFVFLQLAPIWWMCRSRQKSLRQSTSMYKQGLPHHHLKVCAAIDDPSKIIMQLSSFSEWYFLESIEDHLDTNVNNKTQRCSIYYNNLGVTFRHVVCQ